MGDCSEHSADIDGIPVDHDWESGDYPPEDSIYLRGPEIPKDFVHNDGAEDADLSPPARRKEPSEHRRNETFEGTMMSKSRKSFAVSRGAKGSRLTAAAFSDDAVMASRASAGSPKGRCRATSALSLKPLIRDRAVRVLAGARPSPAAWTR